MPVDLDEIARQVQNGVLTHEHVLWTRLLVIAWQTMRKRPRLPPDARDLVQTAVLKVMERLRSRPTGKKRVKDVRAYLKTALRNEERTAHRIRTRQRTIATDPHTLDQSAAHPSSHAAGAEFELAELTEKLPALLRQLAPRERAVFSAVFERKQTIAQVAQRSGVTPRAVRQTLTRALMKLRVLLGENPGSEDR